MSKRPNTAAGELGGNRISKRIENLYDKNVKQDAPTEAAEFIFEKEVGVLFISLFVTQFFFLYLVKGAPYLVIIPLFPVVCYYVCCYVSVNKLLNNKKINKILKKFLKKMKILKYIIRSTTCCNLSYDEEVKRLNSLKKKYDDDDDDVKFDEIKFAPDWHTNVYLACHSVLAILGMICHLLAPRAVPVHFSRCVWDEKDIIVTNTSTTVTTYYGDIYELEYITRICIRANLMYPMVVIYGGMGMLYFTLGWKVKNEQTMEFRKQSKMVYAGHIGQVLRGIHKEDIKKITPLSHNKWHNRIAILLSILFVVAPYILHIRWFQEDYLHGIDYFISGCASAIVMPYVYIIQYSIWAVKNVFVLVNERMDALNKEAVVKILTTDLKSVAEWWKIRSFEQKFTAPVYMRLAEWALSAMFLTDILTLSYLLYSIWVFGFHTYLIWDVPWMYSIAAIIYSSGMLISITEASAIYENQQVHVKTLDRIKYRCSVMLLCDNSDNSKEEKKEEAENEENERITITNWKENLELYNQVIEQSQFIIKEHDAYATIFSIPIKPGFLTFVLGYILTAMGGIVAKAVLDFYEIELS